MKRESEGETTFKMFLPHERHDITGSQTALAECRRAWDLQPKDLNRRNTSKHQKVLEEAALVRGKHFENCFPLRLSFQKLFDVFLFYCFYCLVKIAKMELSRIPSKNAPEIVTVNTSAVNSQAVGKFEPM